MTRTQWVIVGGLSLFILVVFGILLYQLRVPQSQYTPARQPNCLLEQAALAKAAWPTAQDIAVHWRSDAYLVSVETVWNNLTQGNQNCNHWTFIFYAPSKHRMAAIRVADGVGQIVRQGLSANVLPPLPIESWQVDSDQALQSWWSQGGEILFRNSGDPTVGLKVGREPNGNRPLWTIAGSAPESHVVIQVDGSSGDVISAVE